MTTPAERLATKEAADKRLLKWLRREVNQDLRYWRSEPGAIPLERYAQLVADCKAKLELIGWAESWQRVRGPDYVHPGRPDVQVALISDLRLTMAAVRRVAAGYKGRDGWREEWEQA